MIAALLLAGVCATPLTFDNLGPPCADPTVECRCSECFEWDPQPNASRYEIVRTSMDTTLTMTTGIIRGYTEADGTVIPPLTTWCAPKDVPFPQEGRPYQYKVNACNASACVISDTHIDYVAAPYWCFASGVREACYSGDPLFP